MTFTGRNSCRRILLNSDHCSHTHSRPYLEPILCNSLNATTLNTSPPPSAAGYPKHEPAAFGGGLKPYICNSLDVPTLNLP